ncbi:KRI1-like family C-terminal-domain-containing protein [Coemansia spiralis]|nr:KRI1-like family C-terminal-domain-containing protein [Coemansia spiralis]
MSTYKDLNKIDKKKVLRAEERRRRANDDDGDIEDYLSENSESENEASDDDSSSESDAEEDENGELVTPELDAQIMKALTALRSKDKTIYDSNVNFFSEDAIKKSQEAWVSKQEIAKLQSKDKLTLTDYQHKVMVEHGGIINEEAELKKATAGMTHVEEQEALKNAFKKAAIGNDNSGDDSDDDEGSFLVKKVKSEKEAAQEEVGYRKFLLDNMGGDATSKAAFESWATVDINAETADVESTDTSKGVDKDQAFLMDYILNRGWVDKNVGKISAELEAKTIVDKEEDEKEMELADNFESSYNFRFEEEGAGQIKSHPREIEGSLRRKDDRRKLARERAKERKEEKKKQKAEELKRIKNQKKRDILEKLKEIQGITGNKSIGFDALDLDGDFNPAQFDAQMDKLFNSGADTHDDSVKPTWDDDIDVDDLISDSEASYNKRKPEKSAKSIDIGDDDFIMDADYLDQSGSKSVDVEELSSKKNELKDRVSKYMDEYYQLNFNDIIADGIPTRFRYAKVKPVNYGLTPAEILLADEKFLNEYVSVKKIAAYRPEEKIESDLSRYASKKRMIYVKKKAAATRSLWEEQLAGISDKNSKKRRLKPSNSVGDGSANSKPSKKAKKDSSSSEKHQTAEKNKKRGKDSKNRDPSISAATEGTPKAKGMNRRQRKKAKVAEATT